MRQALGCVVLILTSTWASAAGHGSGCSEFLGRTTVEARLGCISNPALSGHCVSVHGRVQLYNGWPQLRVWPVGTDRLLGVLPSECELAPQSVLAHVKQGESVVFVDLVVCPFTNEQPGSMQMVCIESATNLVVTTKDRAGRVSSRWLKGVR